MTDIQNIKNRFGIIGNSPALNYALNVAVQVATTDLSVLIVGESGVGKEVFSQIIHSLSVRKHNPFIAVNCGAIPEGTIDSELFGHEKGAFTGAVDNRKGYFETVNGGTIFLDEIGEMPLGTQARLLRVLEAGEFIRVGSSKVQKTDVRVITATNKELLESTQNGKFRQDLYYRLNTVPIRVPSLRDRKEDITLLFRKFVVDFSERYKTNPLQLNEEAKNLLISYPWQGNVRELKNIAEQISVLSKLPLVTVEELKRFLPDKPKINMLPMVIHDTHAPQSDFMNEREILYKSFFDMKKDLTELKRMFFEVLQNPSMSTSHKASYAQEGFLNDYTENEPRHNTMTQPQVLQDSGSHRPVILQSDMMAESIGHHEEVEESLNLMDREKEIIKKALKKHKFKRKLAAIDLGISERSLYRKIKEYGINDYRH